MTQTQKLYVALALMAGIIVGQVTNASLHAQAQLGLYWQCRNQTSASAPQYGWCPVSATYPLPTCVPGTGTGGTACPSGYPTH